MTEKPFKNLKIDAETHAKLRMIAATNRETLKETVERLADVELKKLENK